MKETQFFKALKALSPPGGGSAAAAYGVLAAELAQQLCLLAEKPAAIRTLRELSSSLCALADADAALLKELLPLFAVGRDFSTDDLPVIRRAASLPCRIAAACLEILEECASLANILPPHALSDLLAAADGAACGIKAAQLVCMTNLPLLPQQESDNLLIELKVRKRQSEKLYAEVEAVLASTSPYLRLYS